MSDFNRRINRLVRVLQPDELQAGITAVPNWNFSQGGAWTFYNERGEEVPQPPSFDPSKHPVKLLWNWNPPGPENNIPLVRI